MKKVIYHRLKYFYILAYYLFETSSGKPIGDGPAYRHDTEIRQLAITQCGPGHLRFIALRDKSNDVYFIPPVHTQSSTSTRGLSTKTSKPSVQLGQKVASMVDSMRWSEDNHLFCALEDGKPKVWYYPPTSFVDPDLAAVTTSHLSHQQSSHSEQQSRDSLSLRDGLIIGFYGLQCLIRRSDGSIFHVSGMNPYPIAMAELVKQRQWEMCVKLGRHVKVGRSDTDEKSRLISFYLNFTFVEQDGLGLLGCYVDSCWRIEYSRGSLCCDR
jgi:intraflagellar transport protein 80